MAPVQYRHLHLLHRRDDLMESDPTPPGLQRNGAAVAGAIIGIILVGLAMIAMVMTLFWKCRVARWKRLERQFAQYEAEDNAAMLAADGKGKGGAQQKPLPTVPASQILASVPNAPVREASQPLGNHYYA
ncbi:hypothetical protein PG985_012655 [Apiospora marii]|uniref:Uncharacterized protein n=1 Tax=Apiospora marii TaxID=335849 RepID=A0ABR1RCM2_9PEZI